MMKIKNFRLLLPALVLMAFTFPASEIKLEYVFKVGDQYSWTQRSRQSIKQSVMGMEQNTETSYDGDMTLKVLELTPTGAKFEVVFLRLKSGTKAPGVDMVIDSDAKDESQQTKIFKALMNKPFVMYMNKRGEIEKMENVDNLWSGFKDLGLDEATTATMKQSMEQMFGQNSLKASFAQALVVYPDKKVKKADTWKSVGQTAMNFPIQVENTWTLADFTAATANITADGTFTTLDKDKPSNLPGGMKARFDLSGKQAMKAGIDLKSGWPSTLEILSEIKGNMTILAGGMIQEDMEIPMEIVSESTFTITKK